jgi:hypothetical protein
MPKGPQGQKRKADVIGNAVLVMKIATGEAEDKTPKTGRAKGGKAGGKKRAETLDAKRRSQIAQAAARKRWSD